MSMRYVGRHRAPVSSPLTTLTAGVARGSRPALSATAAMVASGGLVAGLAISAQADPAPPEHPLEVGSPAAPVPTPSPEPEFTAPRPVEDVPAPVPAPEAPAAPQAPEPAADPEPEPEPATPAPKRPKVADPAPVRGGALHMSASEEASSEAAAGMSVLSTASGLSGIRYRWGGTTPSGFDCSGFTRYVYRKQGITLPRTAAAQQRATKRVSEPRPGDLVFFGRPAHHVGIYAGNGKMYDSPRRGKTTGLHKIWSRNVSYGRVAR